MACSFDDIKFTEKFEIVVNVPTTIGIYQAMIILSDIGKLKSYLKGKGYRISTSTNSAGTVYLFDKTKGCVKLFNTHLYYMTTEEVFERIRASSRAQS